MTVTFTNATLLYGGYSLAGQHNQIGLEYSAESLDETVFGDDTQRKKGGLKVSRLTGEGFFNAGSGTVHQVFMDSHALADAVVMVFPEAIGEGATSTGSGFMMRAVELQYQHGGAVGDLHPFTVSAAGRGAGL